ncbi:MAG: hypothetical protein M3295_04735 [Chloroflexota bacterium]|nr:hypothetical protein [Chloroflexota bacterium]
MTSPALATASRRGAHPLSARWVVLIALYAALGVAGALYLAGSTAPGADLDTYRRAGRDLWELGNPYASAASLPQDYQYRYPPLLAMVIPALGWPPLWYAVMALATAVPIALAYRHAGPAALLPAALLIGPWLQVLVNGNVQPVVVATLALVPLHRRAGAIGLALATMLKLHPALAVVWYAGRRDWSALRWYAAALVVLLLVQAPWLDDFVAYYLADPAATDMRAGMSLRAIGPLVWVAGTVALGVVAFRWADSRYGWLLATLLQLAALPRVLLVNLALLLASPLPPPRRDPR